MQTPPPPGGNSALRSKIEPKFSVSLKTIKNINGGKKKEVDVDGQLPVKRKKHFSELLGVRVDVAER